jgi:hypothetical protein
MAQFRYTQAVSGCVSGLRKLILYLKVATDVPKILCKKTLVVGSAKESS